MNGVPNNCGKEERMTVGAERINTHFWMRAEGDGLKLGLNPDYAESIAGNWVGLELLPAGTSLRAGEGFGFITTDRGTHDLRAPVGMRILEVNRQATENPNIAKLSPTGLGWLIIAGGLDV